MLHDLEFYVGAKDADSDLCAHVASILPTVKIRNFGIVFYLKCRFLDPHNELQFLQRYLMTLHCLEVTMKTENLWLWSHSQKEA